MNKNFKIKKKKDFQKSSSLTCSKPQFGDAVCYSTGGYAPTSSYLKYWQIYPHSGEGGRRKRKTSVRHLVNSACSIMS